MITAYTIFFSALTLWALVSLIQSLIHRRSAGAVLVDAGPNPARGRSMFHGLFAIFFCVGGLAGMSQEFDFLYLSFTIAGATFAIAALTNARGRLQVREKGLWLFSDLIGWDRIVSHSWEGENKCELRLQIKTLYFIKKNSAPLLPIIVPDEFKVPFEEALQKHATPSHASLGSELKTD